ncbi:MAG TPA: ADP-ribosylglycohydrolase family protein [Thermomicrobiales bacterium]|nr:ADP-ribosylglycohydrolase family protein [Thermomicrobiales bacterium]
MSTETGMRNAVDVTSQDYLERVYAGVLGKIIGVYLGRPFEGWLHEDIVEKLGEIDHYVHEQFNMPLIVTDDDIAGTFTFLRALEDNGYDPNLTPAQIGQAWLNYLIEERTVLWWGGMGVSTEHTAYLRLKSGIDAPASGSCEMNGKTISEQIGAQIFIDGWPMLFPGDPERAVDWARRAASVSHDGEAIYGAQVIAAIEAQAFVESDMNALIDTALAFIPGDSIIARVIADVRRWHAEHDDWYETRALIGEHYGYDKFGGACHMVPNHALIIMALLYGEGDLRRSLMIVNTAGWDTDCNAGNVGCILGIRDGLDTFAQTPDYRLPVADKMYLSTAEGGRGITDAVTETIRIANAARVLAGEPSVAPKDGARFHFSLPGSVQGFTVDDDATAQLQPVNDRLELRLNADGSATITTPTFAPEETRPFQARGYRLFASPTLYPGQNLVGNVYADEANSGEVTARLMLRAYDTEDVLVTHAGPEITIAPGQSATMEWTIPALGSCPVQAVGLQLTGAENDMLALDSLTWDGAPTVTLDRGRSSGTMWRQAWVDGVDNWETRWSQDFHLTQNHGTGLIAQGTEGWKDYAVSATARIPLAASAGVAIRIGGMQRYYALVLREGGKAQLVKCLGDVQVLAETPFDWEIDREYAFELRADGTTLRGSIDGEVVLEATDDNAPLTGGSAGFVAECGTIVSGPMTVSAI